jgi:hypothetical protein
MRGESRRARGIASSDDAFSGGLGSDCELEPTQRLRESSCLSTRIPVRKTS